jgi:hypothetical protein
MMGPPLVLTIVVGAMLSAEHGADEPPPTSDRVEGLRFTPFAAPAKTPELGVLIAGGAVISFPLGGSDTQRSQLIPLFGYSTTGALVVGSSGTLYLPEDRVRVGFSAWYNSAPLDYFGVGFTAGATTPRGPETTRYDQESWNFTPDVRVRTWSALFAGVAGDVNETVATELNPRMQQDPHVLRTGTRVLNVGLGPVLEWDTRDVAGDAHTGLYLGGRLLFYPRFLGSTVGWARLKLEYKQFVPVGRGQTLGWWLWLSWGLWDAPWTDLPSVSTLRGYREGQFRDRLVVSGQIEYRLRFLKGDGTVSRHGMVFFAGAATLGSSFLHLDSALPNAGLGYRFELQPRLNIRADVGFGRDSYGVYLSANEAF